MANKRDVFSHTKWLCKYHIVFTPKYRRKAIYGELRKDIEQILRALCEHKGVELIEGHLMPDHVHMLVSIPPRISVAQFMGYLKGKSALMVFDRHSNLKYKFGNRHFWADGYYVSTVGLNTETVRKYIREQEMADIYCPTGGSCHQRPNKKFEIAYSSTPHAGIDEFHWNIHTLCHLFKCHTAVKEPSAYNLHILTDLNDMPIRIIKAYNTLSP